MSEDDLKKFIESVIADMVAAGELEGEIEGEEGEEEGEEEEGEEEEKVEMKEAKEMEKVDELVGSGTDFLELSKALNVDLDTAKYLVVAGGLAVPAILAAIKVGGDKAIQFFKKIAMKKSMEEANEMEEMKSELEEAYSTIKTIKTELQEVNLFNAKLLYTNKIFKAKNLTESQKVKVLAAFDKAASVNEAKLVFETLSEGFKEKKSSVNESMLRGSASKVTGVVEKKPIMEVNDQFTRWQKLAGIK
jgi:ABC-type multidrug transport system fused ATPase/permease subunit